MVGGAGSDALMGELAGWVVPSELTAKWLMVWIDESVTLKQRVNRLRGEFIDFANEVLIRDDKARDSLDRSDGSNWLVYPAAAPGELKVWRETCGRGFRAPFARAARGVGPGPARL